MRTDGDGTSTMSLKKNTIYNLLGSLAPMVLSVVTVPIFLRLVGDARYGVLALVWLFLGYFGLFDPGVARAAEYHVARLHGKENDQERESVFRTAAFINAGFGVFGGIVVFLIARPIFISAFKMPPAMRAEVLTSLPWMAAAIPISLLAGMLGGALQARERFAQFNLINLLGSIVSQLTPLIVAFWHGPDLRWLIPAIIIARTAGAIPMFFLLIKALPLGCGGRFDRNKVKVLFSYGGWVTVSNVLNPILTTVDRMVIGSVFNAQSVAYYSVPFNLVSRASIVPGALATSLFPKLSRGNREDSARLASESVVGLAAVMTLMCVLGSAALPIFMQHWVGAEFAKHAAPVGIILLVGVWVNGLAFIPYSHLQAIERPDLVAKFHAVELIPFLGVLWVGLHTFGLLGAAGAWTLRVTVDAVLLFAVAGQIPGWQRVLPGGLLVILAGVFSPRHILSIQTGVELLILAAAVTWSLKVSPHVRTLALSRLPFKRIPEAA